ncbi:MAG: 3'(2'),5'-bisphosphate nucleotidase [Isosphaerales bacterium]
MNELYEREQGVAIRAVRTAARLCQAVGAEISPEVLAKKDKSPVTVADFGSQALICRALGEAFPEDPVIAEEDAVELRRPASAAVLDQVVRHVGAVWDGAGGGAGIEIDGEQVCRWIDRGGASQYGERFWTLDPIDGTKGFLRGEQYAVALALIVGGHVVVAALACPNLRVRAGREHGEEDGPRGLVFRAARGQGAFVVPGECPVGDEAVPVRVWVSREDDPARVRFCESVESGHSAQGDAAAVAARTGITAPPLRMDSQAKYAVVARGEAEIYLRLPTRSDYREKIWDHAAGALIVEEAGGVVTDINGRPLEFNHGRELAANRGVIVTNGRLHQVVIEAVRGLGIASESSDEAGLGSDADPGTKTQDR